MLQNISGYSPSSCSFSFFIPSVASGVDKKMRNLFGAVKGKALQIFLTRFDWLLVLGECNNNIGQHWAHLYICFDFLYHIYHFPIFKSFCAIWNASVNCVKFAMRTIVFTNVLDVVWVPAV